MSTDLAKEVRGKRKKNLQRWTENSNQNLLLIPQSSFKLTSRFLGTRAKEPLEILPKKRRFMVFEPFIGRLWSGQNNVKVEKFYQEVERLDSFCSWNQITIKFEYFSR